MGNWLRRPLLLIFSFSFLWIAGLSAQEPSDAQGSSANTSDKKSEKKRQKQRDQELGPAYGTWLRDEVPYIITDEERQAFLSLSTNEEREQFIEQFWDRRNPDAESPTNAFREEHYRRLAYADEHFASGTPGRKTDRGRIYIIWGPPDEIESHPTGGTWDRPMQQGGGSTTTYPWEMWRYRYMEGIGENIEIEFVDPSGSGEYKITNDPCEKDALTHVPGAGPSLTEMMGMSTQASRFMNSNGTTCPMPMGGQSANANEFEALERFVKVQQPPHQFKDLEEKVSSRMVTSQLPFEYRADYLRATSDTDLVPITVQIHNKDLGFQSKQGVHSAVLDLYARISSVGGSTVQRFDEVISLNVPDSLFGTSQNLPAVYQKSVPLRAGLYRLDIVIRDTQTGKIGVAGTALRVPRFEDEKLDASSLILADLIEPLASRQIGSGQFALNAYKVRPRVSQEFSASDKLGIYLQLYNLKLDETSHKTKVSVAYRITKDDKEVWSAVETPENLRQGGEQLTIKRFLPVSSLTPGRYMVEVISIDMLSNETVTRSSSFTVKQAAVKANAPAL
jgi:GWxTD domain-containing protein